MSDEKSSTTYQEGVITLSNGNKIHFLCKPLSEILTVDEMKDLTLVDLHFFPEKDLADEFIDDALDKVKGMDAEQEETPETGNENSIDQDISDGYSWDDDVF